jgi:hypothetical protein
MKSFKSKGAQQPKAESRVLGSKEQFTYKDNCLFCGQQASQTDTSKRGIDVFPVRTKDFQINIEKNMQSEMTAGQLMFYQGFSL